MSKDISSDSVSDELNVELSDEIIAKLNYLAKEQKTDRNELINSLLKKAIKE